LTPTSFSLRQRCRIVLWFYYVCRPIVRIILFLLIRWRVSGRENIPEQGPVLVISNHLSLADPPLLNLAIDRPVRYMAKKQLFRFRVLGYFIRGLGAFPVHRGRPDRKAFRQAEEVLAQGSTLVIFPEGTRSRSGQLRHAFSSPTLIALRSGVPILPVGITGTEKLEHVTGLLSRPRVTVNIGRPFHLPTTASKSTKTELTNYIMGRIAEILPEEYRGIYGRQGN
jgi:1-acyl-sn-glycerol-3-phosphate acyltransferase